ncbi:trypsin-like serine peptidase [Nonomuraea sp. NPDC052265]|uniref:trypsin-like serine peptidase n=1 Tax=Nonomuraea sp. NPDC052265 TaxID=3364374 RepID=UPI0037C83BB8
MHRRFALLSILTLATGSIALLPGTAAQAGAAPRPAQHAAADSTSEQRQVTRYWTEGRMESAQPLDLPAPKSGGKAGLSAAAEPGYAAGRRPFGTRPATKLLTTPQWNAGEDVDFDVAAAVVAQVDGKSLVDVVGGQGVAFNQRRGRQMHSFGYPAAAPYDGSKLIYCSGRTFDDFLLSDDLALTCDMTGGASGGPWMLNFNESTGLGTQNSVNSFKYNFAPNWMFGPYFGNEAQAVYQAAQNTNAL